MPLYLSISYIYHSYPYENPPHKYHQDIISISYFPTLDRNYFFRVTER